MQRFPLLALTAALPLAACQPDASVATETTGTTGTDSTTTEPTDTETGGDAEDPGTQPEGVAVLLHTLSPDGTPIPRAQVIVDGTVHLTNDAGFLQFENLEGSRLRARVDAPGFVSAALAVDLGEGLSAYEKVTLLPLAEPIEFDASAGGTIEHEGITVTLPPGGLVNRFGEPVTGVASITLTPVSLDTSEPLVLPGPLEGQSADDEEVGLLSLAMADISLWQNDEPLQLAEGMSATLSFALPDSQLEPGTTIPAWHLDLDAGIWEQRALGTVVLGDDLQSRAWTTQVDHFSIWNCDEPFPYGQFECYVVSFVDADDASVLLPNKGFASTATYGEGTFWDAGHSSPSLDNTGNNCVLAPIGSTIDLSVQGQPGMDFPAEGSGLPGLCQTGEGLNSQCTPIIIPLGPDIVCDNGAHKDCPYTGPEATEDIGICQAAKDYCIEGGTKWSGCLGEIVPDADESCATLWDDDCDGEINEAGAIDCECEQDESIPCYEGPFGTEGVGICVPGVRHCDGEMFLESCEGQQTPLEEDDATVDEDENCDGLNTKAPPEPPTPELVYVPIKQLVFGWQSSLGAQSYNIYNQDDELLLSTEDTNAALAVSLHRQLDTSYTVEACNEWGCTASDPVDAIGPLAAVGYVKAPNTNPGDYFGESVALSADGNTLAIGAAYEDSNATGIDGNTFNNGALNSGAVYVYRRDEVGMWALDAYVKGSNTQEGDYFGQSVALSADGSMLVVGAFHEDSNTTGIDGDASNNAASSSGAAYVFTRDDMGAWVEEAYVKASNTGENDQFGYSIALSADASTLAVGARYDDSNATGIDGDGSNNSVSNSGAAYVYRRDEMGVWTDEAYIKASNTDASDQFGASLALSEDGSTLVVGAWLEDSNATNIDGDASNNAAAYAGAAYVYTRTEMGVWSPEAYIKAPNAEAGDRFAISLALSLDGDTLAVGAFHEGSSATGVDGDSSDNAAAESGAAYVYGRDDMGVWMSEAYIKASNTDPGDQFGHDIALNADGTLLAVGASNEQSDAIGVNADPSSNAAAYAGAVYVYSFDGSDTWTSDAYVKAPNTDPGDRFGIRLRLSADGGTLAVGANAERSIGTLLSADPQNNTAAGAGAVYLY